MSGPLILGIESSCDETGVGIVRGNDLLANEVASSVEEHVRFGGVVPEVASRAHLQALIPALRRACQTADIDLSELDGIAVTAGPGLMGALVVGVAAAKALAVALDKPLYGVNHLVGHVAVDLLDHGPLPQPCAALLVSGGHTSLLAVNDITGDIVELGATIDDAAGEAYDKVARLLGLPYPGGPVIDKAAADGDPRAIAFPRGLTANKDQAQHRFDYSFSGLKTAVSRWVEIRRRDGEEFRSPTWPRPSRRPSATCSRPRRSTPASTWAPTTCCWVGEWLPTRGFGPCWRSGPLPPASRCAGRVRPCAPTTAP